MCMFACIFSRDKSILPRTVSLCTWLLPRGDATPTLSFDHVTLTKVALQLLGNACAGYPEGQERVWQLCFPQHFRYI